MFNSVILGLMISDQFSIKILELKCGFFTV